MAARARKVVDGMLAFWILLMAVSLGLAALI
jgi:hypothetical protein